MFCFIRTPKEISLSSKLRRTNFLDTWTFGNWDKCEYKWHHKLHSTRPYYWNYMGIWNSYKTLSYNHPNDIFQWRHPIWLCWKLNLVAQGHILLIKPLTLSMKEFNIRYNYIKSFITTWEMVVVQIDKENLMFYFCKSLIWFLLKMNYPALLKKNDDINERGRGLEFCCSVCAKQSSITWNIITASFKIITWMWS